MIEVKNLTKTFGENTVFKDLCFKIDDGEFVVFSGKSGCGKTTMLNLIGGIDTPDSGEILIDGENILTGGKHNLSVSEFCPYRQ